MKLRNAAPRADGDRLRPRNTKSLALTSTQAAAECEADAVRRTDRWKTKTDARAVSGVLGSFVT